MGVKLRWRILKDGTTRAAFLDCYYKGIRKKVYLDIKIQEGDQLAAKKTELAELARSKKEVEMASQLLGIITEEKKSISLEDYFTEFLDAYYKPGKRKYEGSFNHLKRHINKAKKKNIKLIHIDRSFCQGFADYLYSGDLSGETPHDYYKRFKQILNKAVQEGYLKSNPGLSISKIKRPRATLKKDVLTTEEIQVLFKTKCGNDNIKRAYLLACFTGLGLAEIRKLKWKDVKNNKIHTHRSKNGEAIINKLNNTSIRLLGERKGNDQLIFPGIPPYGINKTIKNWVAKAGINKHITFYTGRHTFAILLLEAGTDLKTVSDLLGHINTAYTVKYLNHNNPLKDQAIDGLPELI